MVRGATMETWPPGPPDVFIKSSLTMKPLEKIYYPWSEKVNKCLCALCRLRISAETRNTRVTMRPENNNLETDCCAGINITQIVMSNCIKVFIVYWEYRRQTRVQWAYVYDALLENTAEGWDTPRSQPRCYTLSVLAFMWNRWLSGPGRGLPRTNLVSSVLSTVRKPLPASRDPSVAVAL